MNFFSKRIKEIHSDVNEILGSKPEKNLLSTTISSRKHFTLRANGDIDGPFFKVAVEGLQLHLECLDHESLRRGGIRIGNMYKKIMVPLDGSEPADACSRRGGIDGRFFPVRLIVFVQVLELALQNSMIRL